MTTKKLISNSSNKKSFSKKGKSLFGGSVASDLVNQLSSVNQCQYLPKNVLNVLNKDFIMTITPEGSRSKVKQWRSGFYQIAKKANVPICLGYVDYKNKIAGVGGVDFPTSNIDHDMTKIMEFYKTKTAKFPEKFSIDLRYN